MELSDCEVWTVVILCVLSVSVGYSKGNGNWILCSVDGRYSLST